MEFLDKFVNHSVVKLLVILMIIVIFIDSSINLDILRNRSSFSNPNDSQYNQRYVAADVPVASQISLNDRLMVSNAKAAAAVKARETAMKSSMTGYRDPPIFWQDHDIDMNIVDGNLYNDREGPASSFNNRRKDCGIPGADC